TGERLELSFKLHHDEVLKFRYEMEGMDSLVALLNFFGRWVPGKKFQQVLSFSWEDVLEELGHDQELVELATEGEIAFLALFQQMVQTILFHFEGRPGPLSELKAELPENLICRCFGIFKSEVLDVL